MQVSCFECALRACGLFKPISTNELGAINEIKHDHVVLPAGAEIIRAGEDSPEIYTLYSGWAFRFKMLPDGRRQILNFLLPGDLVGLQAAMFDAAQHGIEALTEVQLCLLPRRKVWGLFGEMPGLAFDVTFLFPLTQQHIADALGLSLVHTNKTLARLRKMGMFARMNGSLTLTNPRVLERIGQYFDEEIPLRPLI